MKEALLTVDESQTPAVTANTDEASCNKLLNLTSPKVALSRTGIKSMRMEHTLLLGKMDARRLKEKPENKNDCYAHECKHCGMSMKFQYEVR